VSGRAQDAVGAVFQALLEAALRDAAAGAFEDEEEDEGKGNSPCLNFKRASSCLLHIKQAKRTQHILPTNCYHESEV